MTARSVSSGGSPASSSPALTYCSSVSIRAAIYRARRCGPPRRRSSGLIRLRERRLARRNIERQFVVNASDEPTSACPYTCTLRPAAPWGRARLRIERARGRGVRRRSAAPGRLPAELPGDRARDRLPGPDRDAQEPVRDHAAGQDRGVHDPPREARRPADFVLRQPVRPPAVGAADAAEEAE